METHKREMKIYLHNGRAGRPCEVLTYIPSLFNRGILSSDTSTLAPPPPTPHPSPTPFLLCLTVYAWFCVCWFCACMIPVYCMHGRYMLMSQHGSVYVCWFCTGMFLVYAWSLHAYVLAWFCVCMDGSARRGIKLYEANPYMSAFL